MMLAETGIILVYHPGKTVRVRLPLPIGMTMAGQIARSRVACKAHRKRFLLTDSRAQASVLCLDPDGQGSSR
jgi:hypothetical protein